MPSAERKPLTMEKHLEALRTCRLCPGVYSPPVLGAAPGAAIMLMGQAPGPKEREVGRPFAWTAGKTLFRWMDTIGATEEQFRSRVYMGSLIRCFPGKLSSGQGDRKPSPQEVNNCLPHFMSELTLLRPRLVLLVGKMAIERFIPHRRLDEVVGRTFALEAAGHRFTAAPLPHPSGLSRWIQSAHGKALIAQGLDLISREQAWRETFGRPSPP